MSDQAERPALADEETMILPPGERNGDAPTSIVDALRAKRADRALDQTFDLEVPGWGGMLVLRCGPLPQGTLSKLVERATTSRARSTMLDANCDMLIAACREVWGRKTPGAELEVVPDADGEPLRLTKHLAEVLQLNGPDGEPLQRGRDVVIAVYSGVPSPELAIGQSTTEYMEWATAANQDIDEELLGES